MRRLARVVCGAGLALLSGAAFAPVFAGTGRYVGVIAGAVALVTVVCLLLHAGAAGPPVYRVAAAVGALAGYVWLVVAPGVAVLTGPKRLLTTALPVEPAGPELAAVTVVVGLAALAAVEPALRSKSPVWQALAPLAVTGVGCAVAASAGAPAGWLAPALAAGVAMLLLLERYRQPAAAAVRPHRTLRGLAGALRVVTSVLTLLLLAGVALAGWYGPTLAGGAQRVRPADARDLVDQAVSPKVATSPLAMFSALRSGRRTLSLSVTAARAPEVMRYAGLDRFDGTSWTADPLYRRAGRWLPGGPPVPAEIIEEEVVVLDGEAMGWLVSSGRAVEVSVAGLGVDEAGGDVVIPAGVAVPRRYTVRSAVPTGRPDGAIAAAGRAEQAPVGFVEWARQITGPERGDVALRRLEQHFIAEYSLDTSPSAPGGHGVFAINRLRQERRGTAEQYASAFAVLARGLGYDVRVVVGFRPQRVGAAEYSVTGRDVHAWAEVRYEGVGWVRYDPTPARPASSGGAEEGEEEDSGAQPPPSAPVGPAPASTQASAGAQTGGGGSGRNPWLLVLLVVLAVYFAGVPAAKAARRVRRRGDPRRAIVHAWREAAGRLAEARLPILASDTALQVADAARGRFGDTVAGPVHDLALLHNEAVFSAGGVGVPEADRAWQTARAIRGALRHTVGPIRRLVSMFDPRPLLPRNW